MNNPGIQAYEPKGRTPRARFIQALRDTHAGGAVCEFQAWWCPQWTVRRVLEIRSKDVILDNPKPDHDRSWLNFPKAAEVTEPERGLFRILDEGAEARFALEYRFTVPDPA